MLNRDGGTNPWPGFLTAEVAILNREAVVIAADSAVTLGSPVGKVYNSANKLFALSRVEPVAVMVYGGGSFEGIPWETVVKEHRRQLSLRPLETIEDYAEEFIKYLPCLVRHVPVEFQHERLRARARWELEKLHEGIHPAKGDGPSDDEESTVENLLGRVDSRISELETLYLEGGPCESVAMQELNTAIDDWDGMVRKCLGSLPVTDEVTERTRLMVCTSLRVASGLPGWSGIVIAGFGTAQLFPALSHYLVDGVIAGQVRARRRGILAENPGRVGHDGVRPDLGNRRVPGWRLYADHRPRRGPLGTVRRVRPPRRDQPSAVRPPAAAWCMTGGGGRPPLAYCPPLCWSAWERTRVSMWPTRRRGRSTRGCLIMCAKSAGCTSSNGLGWGEHRRRVRYCIFV